MQHKLEIIEEDDLFGLVDVNNYQVVECVYDKIEKLANGLFLVIKENMSGLLDSEGHILLLLQPNRLIYIKEIDVFKYKENGKKYFFRILNDKISYIDIDNLWYYKKNQVVILFKGDLCDICNRNFELIDTVYDIVKPTDIRLKSDKPFYLGAKDGLWGVFRIKFSKKTHEIISVIDTQYASSEEVCVALKEYVENTRAQWRERSMQRKREKRKI